MARELMLTFVYSSWNVWHVFRHWLSRRRCAMNGHRGYVRGGLLLCTRCDHREWIGLTPLEVYVRDQMEQMLKPDFERSVEMRWLGEVDHG